MTGDPITVGGREGAILEEVARLRDERNRETVTSRLVAQGMNLSSKQVGPILDTFADGRYLEPWGSSTPQTYIIKFDGDVEISTPD